MHENIINAIDGRPVNWFAHPAAPHAMFDQNGLKRANLVKGCLHTTHQWQWLMQNWFEPNAWAVPSSSSRILQEDPTRPTRGLCKITVICYPCIRGYTLYTRVWCFSTQKAYGRIPFQWQNRCDTQCVMWQMDASENKLRASLQRNMTGRYGDDSAVNGKCVFYRWGYDATSTTGWVICALCCTTCASARQCVIGARARLSTSKCKCCWPACPSHATHEKSSMTQHHIISAFCTVRFSPHAMRFGGGPSANTFRPRFEWPPCTSEFAVGLIVGIFRHGIVCVNIVDRRFACLFFWCANFASMFPCVREYTLWLQSVDTHAAWDAINVQSERTQFWPNQQRLGRRSLFMSQTSNCCLLIVLCVLKRQLLLEYTSIIHK